MAAAEKNQRLKPRFIPGGFFGTTEQPAEKSLRGKKNRPQRLKPDSFWTLYGATEVVPLYQSVNHRVFRKL